MKKSAEKKSSEQALIDALDPASSQIVLHNIEEIKSMREEINWRVRVAYNSSIVFISVFSFVVGQLLSADENFLDVVSRDPDLLIKVGMAILVLISAWTGVQNANHLIEKRIELYTLELMRTIYANSKHVYFSWLGYLYGSVFFKKRVKNLVAKFLNASIGLFIYLLPNLVAISFWGYLISLDKISDYTVLFTVASFFLLVAIGTSLFLFFYVIKVNNSHTEFYKSVMKPYYENQEILPGVIPVSGE